MKEKKFMVIPINHRKSLIFPVEHLNQHQNQRKRQFLRRMKLKSQSMKNQNMRNLNMRNRSMKNQST